MKRLDRIIEEYRVREAIAGISVSVTDKEKTLYSSGFGVESALRPEIGASGGSLYRIASITKMFTGITALRLCEMGVLSLDTPIKEYLPYLKLKHEEATERVTMRHLLSHTSGLPAEYTPVGPRDESMLKEVLTKALPTLKLIGLPEEKYLYSNWGIRLASLVITELTGKPFSETCGELVLAPLGLLRTTFDLGVAATLPLSLPHQRNEGGHPTVLHKINENATRLATGGLFSTVDDLAIFGRMLLCDGVCEGGKPIIRADSLTEMRKWISTAKSGNGYGLTTTIYPHGDVWLFGHAGSAAPYASALLYDLDSRLSVAVLQNTEGKGPVELAKNILDTVKAIKNEA